MTKSILVGFGGFLGSIARYLAGGAVHRLAEGSAFPYGTLFVNVTGCLAIGFLAALSEARGVLSPEARVFLMVGVLGGYTTFSSFGYETLQLVRGGEMLAAAANVLIQVVVGLGAVWAGAATARMIWG
ncbi:MAG TPA: fluoride efflux transporter CrcB [Candidatus Binatia bacterium]|nr:fluoride efflux transporter CrcB [Candidatus Binatia bacterium]